MGKETDSLLEMMSQIDKQYGKGSVINGNSVIETKRLSTGSLKLDFITGGGWGLGRIASLLGAESSGKTTICIHTMIEAQKDYPDKKVVMIDTEHAFDRYYAESLGLIVDDMIISQPDSGEAALGIAEKLISTGKVSVCIIDSIAALVPQAELEGEMEDNQMGLQARLMSKGMRKLTGIVSKTDTVLIFTNQTREKIGVMYGNPTTYPGGNAEKFYSSIRVELSKKQGEKSGDTVLTSIVTCKTIKNKLASPFQKCDFEIRFGEGIDKASEIIDLCVFKGIIEVSGSWYSYDGTRIGQGLLNVKSILKDNPNLIDELETKLREQI